MRGSVNRDWKIIRSLVLTRRRQRRRRGEYTSGRSCTGIWRQLGRKMVLYFPQLYRKAADGGHAVAMLSVGFFYERR